MLHGHLNFAALDHSQSAARQVSLLFNLLHLQQSAAPRSHSEGSAMPAVADDVMSKNSSSTGASRQRSNAVEGGWLGNNRT